MILTDHEWLRFVTFGLVAGATLGALYTAALLSLGRTILGATAGAVLAGGAFAVLFHLVGRWLLARATDEPASESTDATTEETT